MREIQLDEHGYSVVYGVEQLIALGLRGASTRSSGLVSSLADGLVRPAQRASPPVAGAGVLSDPSSVINPPNPRRKGSPAQDCW